MKYLPVTVIIPTWNRSALLQRALDSVFRQSAPCAEVIVVDDGSEDETPQLLKQQRDHQCLKVIRQKNRGAAAARNSGIAAAANDYIAFLDSDDHWQKKKLEVQFAAFADSDFLISHTYEKWLRNGQHLNQKKIHIPRHGDIFTHCLRLCAVGMSTVMVKKELFAITGLFDESMHCCEDYDLWLRASAKVPFLLVKERLTIKEGGRPDQLSRRYRMGMDELRIGSIRRLLASGSLRQGQQDVARKELLRKLKIFGAGCIKHGKIELGQKYLAMMDEYM